MKAQSKAQLRYLRMSPQKVRLIGDMIRGMKVASARAQLAFSGKHAARPMKKLLESAIANAKNNHGMDEKTLRIESLFVNEGPILYRWMPRAMGRATPIRKRSSHVTIVLEGESTSKVQKKTEKQKETVPSEDLIVEEPKKKVSKTKKVISSKKKVNTAA